jgi:type IV secretory pathway TraG/TraD family ATPase VirD4
MAQCAAPHKLLMMLDEFPALGRLDFFETSLAFLAGYGVRAFLIAQSLNQIEKAYGEHNAILDNCHVRVAFATNDERTAKRISDALGTATEQRAMRNYAGHRLAPWLSACHGQPAGDRPRPADARRGDAAARDRRAGPGRGDAADPRQSCAISRTRSLRCG